MQAHRTLQDLKNSETTEQAEERDLKGTRWGRCGPLSARSVGPRPAQSWAAVLLAACSFVATSAAARSKHRAPEVRTLQGIVRGTRVDSVEKFLAIPYAAPPVGALRWSPPKPPPSWSGVRQADVPPASCPQLVEGASGQEDCLYLNVYRPSHRARQKLLPVLLFIHGGALKNGSAIDNDPSRIAANTNSVVVMINYRLGQFGFLAHPALGADAGDGTSGEYGLMDQQAALQWVQENVTEFGGDPERVTLAGMSAGGWSVCAHLTSPSAEGLFAQAAILSAGCPSEPLEAAETRGLEFAAIVGCAGVEPAKCLRSKTTAELLAGDSFNLYHIPVSGGRLLPEAPQVVVEAGESAAVPVLLGGASEEANILMADLYPMTEAEYAAELESLGDALERYPASDYDDPFYAFAAAVSDAGGVGPGSCTNLRLARTLSAQAPTYVYEFDDPSAPIPSYLQAAADFDPGASHGSDEIYWFDRPADTIDNLNHRQRRLARRMIRYLGRFMKTGTPSTSRLPFWPSFGQTEQVLSFQLGKLSLISDFADRNHCEFWQSLGF